MVVQVATICPVIDVPGVTFPVTDVWWEGVPWDPVNDGALKDLCTETLRIFNHEGSGNVLVFLCMVRDVEECVSTMKALLSHDKNTDVLPLYASLPEDERDAVVGFCDNPANKSKRFICFRYSAVSLPRDFVCIVLSLSVCSLPSLHHHSWYLC